MSHFLQRHAKINAINFHRLSERYRYYMVQHCCQDMDDSLKFECTEHADKFECPDTLVTYNAKFDEYGLIIHDGGSSSKAIYYCSWCGSKLPDSKRDLWFDTLEDLGFDEPTEQDIPKEFKSGAWFKYL